MEQTQFETLNNAGSLFPFPPHRRRHLKSETFCTLVRILSHCHGDSHLHSREAVQEETKQGNGECELGQVTGPESCGELVGPKVKEPEISLIQRDDQSLKFIGSDESVNEDRMEMDEFDNADRIKEAHFWENGIKIGNTLDDRDPSSNVASMVDNQEGQSSPLDKECYNCKVDEALDLSSDIDVAAAAESPKLDENIADGSRFVEVNLLEEEGHDMQLMEVEKLVSNSGEMDSPLCVTADEEIEEGEISGNSGLYGQSIDLLLEDAVSSERKEVDREQNSGAILNKEQSIYEEHKGASQEDNKTNSNFAETVGSVINEAGMELRESNFLKMECKSEMVLFGKNGDDKISHGHDFVLETGRNEKQASGANEGNKPTVPDKISAENAMENQGNLSAKKDAGVHKKKKRGPLTEEKRAKKKKKERIKRAQKNRQLGVKRLKIQPVLKPKTVSYCRHYLKGRCQKGEQCNFSHDTIPSTKSKPCCHFARQSCMKGDDCPYDHQLSKYPCNNYLSNGYCSRGTDCMFSHEVLPKEGCPSTSNVSIPELKSSSLLRGSNTDKQLNLQSSSTQKVDSKSGISVIAPRKNTEQNVAEKPAVQTPKGISKLLFGKSSLGNPSKINQTGLSPKEGGVGVCSQTHHTPAMSQNSNGITRMAAAVEPKGTNFLSFGKASQHDSSSEKPSSMAYSKDYGIQKSAYCDLSKHKQPALCAKKDDGLKVVNQVGQSAREMVQNLSEMPKRALAPAPRGINFLSFGKAPLDDSSTTKQASLSSNGDSAFLSSVQETESAPRVQIPNSKPWSLPSSLVPSDQSLDRLADERGKGTPSSALKALLSNTPNSSQMANLSNASNSAHKALQSTLTFASKLESKIKMDHPAVSADFNKEGSSSHNTSRGSTILDFLRGGGSSKTKQ